ncbi:hypothetical protein ABZP36_016991 [Zizania latifolia]
MVGGGSSGGGAEAGIMSPAGGGGKRGRGAEEDVYVDNLHSHKRYLSEIMASSLNGLSVGDSVSENIMMSPVRLESTSSFRDEIISQYSPMSEDSDDYRYYDTQVNGNGSQTDVMVSPSTSPISSPHRVFKPNSGFSSANPYTLPNCSLSTAVCSNARHGAESEGRFPSSPNDMSHCGDLRRTALLRSVQMRVQGPNAYELSFSSGHEQEQECDHERSHGVEHGLKHASGIEVESGSFSCTELIQDKAKLQSPKTCSEHQDHDVDFAGEHSSDYGMTDAKFDHEKDLW